ncbi:esterase/lipase family protein [Nocardia fluminea]|uniref:esterase/lipase family protein n=1 Tax=Nocardia fluminea TaxID=134984 RepID=UPI00364ADB44
MRFIAGIATVVAVISTGGIAAAEAPATPFETLTACPASTRTDPPVLLIPGTNATVDKSLGPVREALIADGRCVYSLEYDSTQPISDSVTYFTSAVERIQEANPGQRIEVIGKSQGALIARAVSLKFADRAVHPIRTVIAISGPQHGVGTVAGIEVPSKAARALPPELPFPTPAVRDMLAGSAYLSELNNGPMTAPEVRYVMTATSYDRTVTPYTSAFIDAPNVTNILVQDGCPEDHTGHIAGSTDPRTTDLVLHALDPVRHPTIRCAANNDGR